MTTPPLETVSVGTKAPLGRSETSPSVDIPLVVRGNNPPVRWEGDGSDEGSYSLVDQEGVRSLVIGVESVRRQVERWVDYDVAQRTKEGLQSPPETHLTSPPTWPSHGQLRAWSALFKRVEQALAVMSPRIEQDQGRDTKGVGR